MLVSRGASAFFMLTQREPSSSNNRHAAASSEYRVPATCGMLALNCSSANALRENTNRFAAVVLTWRLVWFYGHLYRELSCLFVWTRTWRSGCPSFARLRDDGVPARFGSSLLTIAATISIW